MQQGAAQILIQGHVKNKDGQDTRGASLIAQDLIKNNFLGFALSSKEGTYRLQLKATPKDSIVLKISHLSYAAQSKIIPPKDQTIDFSLSAETYTLPDMFVEQPAFERRGDTLVFDVQRMKGKGDESIEDVLKRIPGITIESSGQILYDDLPISKFYIEGLDMLEGRYALATRNLNADKIRDIEVLEEHQAIRALDSLVRPPNAAINLRLKSKVVYAGAVALGGGLSPSLYLGKGDVFGFQEKQQFNLLAAANNIGQRQRSDFVNLYEQVSVERSLLSPSLISVPFEPDNQNTLYNHEYTGGFNYLRKLSKEAQFKWQGLASIDRLNYMGKRLYRLRDETQSFGFDEQLRAEEVPLTINTALYYELNRPRFFTKISLECKKGQRTTSVDNQINGLDSEEQFLEERTSIKGKLESIFRKGNKAYWLWSKVDYTEADFGLELLPLDVFVAELPPFQLERAIQNGGTRQLKSDTYTSFLFKRRNLSGNFSTGFKTNWLQLESDLQERSADGSAQPLGELFENSNEIQLLQPYFNQSYLWKKKNKEWRLSLPLSLHSLGVQDLLSREENRYNILVSAPTISYIHILPSKHSLSVDANYKRDYNQDQNFYNAYLLRQNRFFDRQSFELNQRTQYGIGIRYQGKSIRSGLYFNSYINLNWTRLDLLATTIFDEQGQSTVLVSNEGLQQGINWENRMSLAFGAWDFALVGNYSFYRQPNILNGVRTEVYLNQLLLQPKISYTFDSAVISFKPSLQYFDNTFSDNAVFQSKLGGTFYYQFSKNWGSAKLDIDYFATYIGQTTQENYLLNLVYKNKIPSLNLDISLRLNNLSNAPFFVSYRQGSFYDELTRYRLRPRQIVLVLARKF